MFLIRKPVDSERYSMSLWHKDIIINAILPMNKLDYTILI